MTHLVTFFLIIVLFANISSQSDRMGRVTKAIGTGMRAAYDNYQFEKERARRNRVAAMNREPSSYRFHSHYLRPATEGNTVPNVDMTDFLDHIEAVDLNRAGAAIKDVTNSRDSVDHDTASYYNFPLSRIDDHSHLPATSDRNLGFKTKLADINHNIVPSVNVENYNFDKVKLHAKQKTLDPKYYHEEQNEISSSNLRPFVSRTNNDINDGTVKSNYMFYPSVNPTIPGTAGGGSKFPNSTNFESLFGEQMKPGNLEFPQGNTNKKNGLSHDLMYPNWPNVDMNHDKKDSRPFYNINGNTPSYSKRSNNPKYSTGSFSSEYSSYHARPLKPDSSARSDDPRYTSMSGNPNYTMRSSIPLHRTRSETSGYDNKFGSLGYNKNPYSSRYDTRSWNPGYQFQSGSSGYDNRSRNLDYGGKSDKYGYDSRSSSPVHSSRSGSPGYNTRSPSPGYHSRYGSTRHGTRSVNFGYDAKSGHDTKYSTSGYTPKFGRSNDDNRSSNLGHSARYRNSDYVTTSGQRDKITNTGDRNFSRKPFGSYYNTNSGNPNYTPMNGHLESAKRLDTPSNKHESQDFNEPHQGNSNSRRSSSQYSLKLKKSYMPQSYSENSSPHSNRFESNGRRSSFNRSPQNSQNINGSPTTRINKGTKRTGNHGVPSRPKYVPKKTRTLGPNNGWRSSTIKYNHLTH